MWPELIGSKLSNPTIITSQAGNTTGASQIGTPWLKPPQASWVYIMMAGAGAGGGGGAGTSAAADSGGGGGGASAGHFTLLMPAQFVPDVLLFALGGGGPGGAGGVLGNGSSGVQGGDSRIASGSTQQTLVSIGGPLGGGAGTTTVGGAGGTGGIATATPWTNCGFFTAFAGTTGGAGGFGSDGGNVTRTVFTSGCGGAGARLDGDRSGGQQVGIFLYRVLLGGTIASIPSGRIFESPPFSAAGGPGGAGLITTPAQNGAPGWFGCGGGGGGSCSAVASATGGAGGRGGDGIAFIWSF